MGKRTSIKGGIDGGRAEGGGGEGGVGRKQPTWEHLFANNKNSSHVTRTEYGIPKIYSTVLYFACYLCISRVFN
jgi:hypothetical protein